MQGDDRGAPLVLSGCRYDATIVSLDLTLIYLEQGRAGGVPGASSGGRGELPLQESPR